MSVVSISACAQAAASGDLATVQLYIASGGDVNARNLFQSQLLHIASREGQVDIAKLLLDAGAELNGLDYGGMRRTSLHWACQQGHLELVELLVDRGANTKVWCNLDWLEQAQGKAWSKLVQGQRCGKMIDTEAPYGELPANLCKNDALKLALERPSWSPAIHHRFPVRFKAAVKAFVLSAGCRRLLRPPGCSSLPDTPDELNDALPGSCSPSSCLNKNIADEEADDGTAATEDEEDEERDNKEESGWCLPDELLHGIVSSIAYPISHWVQDGDWAPPEPLLIGDKSSGERPL